MHIHKVGVIWFVFHTMQMDQTALSFKYFLYNYNLHDHHGHAQCISKIVKKLFFLQIPEIHKVFESTSLNNSVVKSYIIA